MQQSRINIILAKPRGFCAGVERAINIVERALKKFGAPVYVKHEIVHNKYVVEDLKSKGAIFVDEIDQIPNNSVTIFSAHGVSREVENNAKTKNLPVIDATCPLVKKVHKEVYNNEKQGAKIILIGHEGHPEVEGTSGQIDSEVFLIQNVADIDKLNFTTTEKLYYVTQTTLSVDDTKEIIYKLKHKFPQIEGPETNDICYATQNRQKAVRILATNDDVELILVIGAKNSSNSNRLRDLGEMLGTKSYLINGPDEINVDMIKGIKSIGITAGASAPEILVQKVIERLSELTEIKVTTMQGIEENVSFNIPNSLRDNVA